ncbi:putative intracellular protease/amidase [Phyllobacterium sp. 1468]|uniref:type 1 glutamine amidotransferase domain-containing protein n=1 Tax=Phyllobacterium sp. 1468 TaxID=2817759 RepID=UPI00285C4FAA|nr:type 1 glutamine amidotransferase domain-containing protein [Phyllobacterium sp. 1468]MDR6632604.1 putative intracellular protease/amidase [Phyllobacterium sp. 1468]
MKILFIVTSADLGYWLAELTRPYWHLTERGHEVHLASPGGGRVVHDRLSNPATKGSWEANDLVSKGFLSDEALVALLDSTTALNDVTPEDYDGVHVVGGTGAAVDLFPNEHVERILEHFWSAGKVVGAICHGTIALANNPVRISGRKATGFSLKEDLEAEKLYGKGFIPNFPQPVLEKAGIDFVHVEPWGVRVVVDGKLITGQNQQSASEYSIAFNHLLAGSNPVLSA